MDRQYTVEECYALCTNEPDCGAFVITKVNFDTDILPVHVSRKQVDGQFPKAACLLFREGCNREGSTLLFDTYEMKDCQNKSKLFDY